MSNNFLRFPEYCDYILHNTDWVKFWNMIHCFLEEGVSHVGSENFRRTTTMEKIFAHCIKNATHVNKEYDIQVVNNAIELKFSKDPFHKRKPYTKSIILQNTRPKLSKKEETLTEEERANVKSLEALKQYNKWLEDARYDYLMIINYEDRRIFATDELAAKQYSKHTGNGIVAIFPKDKLTEIRYWDLMEPFYTNQFSCPEKTITELENEAFEHWCKQF